MLGAAMLLVPWSVLSWNKLVGTVMPAASIRFRTDLFGVFVPPSPVLSIDAVLSGDFQREYAKLIGMRTPIYRTSVKLKNQLLYSAFDTTDLPTLLIGRKHYLYEWVYVQEYCSRDLAQFEPQAAAWAPRIRQLQDWYESRGKTFLYVITPSKAAVYPQYFPKGYVCYAPAADRDGLLPAWHHALDSAGVHYVDTAQITADARSKYPIELFPRGGTHWNRLAAALGTQAIIDAIDTQKPATLLQPLTFTWQLSYKPLSPEDDLLKLLNLMWPDRHYEVPLLHYAPPATSCRPARIAIIGGSFLHQIGEALLRSACPPQVDGWSYWKVFHIAWSNDTILVLPLNKAERDRNVLQDANIVILEENEVMVARSNHGPAFYDAVMGIPPL